MTSMRRCHIPTPPHSHSQQQCTITFRFRRHPLEHDLAIVGWGVPDVTDALSRDAEKELVRSADPDAPEDRIGSIMSQLHSFLSDMKEGDVVVLPLKTQGPKVALGRIT